MPKAHLVVRGVRAPGLVAPPVKPRRVRVLVAEDKAAVRDAAAEMLTHRGMIVRKTSKAEQLLDNVKRFKPDVVVLDDYFERSGLSFSKLLPSLLETFPNVRVIVTSDNPPDGWSYMNDPRSWGAFAVVAKDHILQGKSLDRFVTKAAGL